MFPPVGRIPQHLVGTGYVSVVHNTTDDTESHHFDGYLFATRGEGASVSWTRLPPDPRCLGPCHWLPHRFPLTIIDPLDTRSIHTHTYPRAPLPLPLPPPPHHPLHCGAMAHVSRLRNQSGQCLVTLLPKSLFFLGPEPIQVDPLLLYSLILSSRLV